MGIRDATRADVPALSRMLAGSFSSDPFHGWAIATPRARLRRSPRFYAAMMNREINRSRVLMTHGGQAAAIWHSSQAGYGLISEATFHLKMIEILRHRVVPVGIGTALTSRFHPKAPHWFLVVLGVDPNQQERGYGTALMTPILQECDRAGRLAYLEASTERNVEYYHRFGFEVIESYRLPLGPVIFPMVRHPLATSVDRSEAPSASVAPMNSLHDDKVRGAMPTTGRP